MVWLERSSRFVITPAIAILVRPLALFVREFILIITIAVIVRIRTSSGRAEVRCAKGGWTAITVGSIWIVTIAVFISIVPLCSIAKPKIRLVTYTITVIIWATEPVCGRGANNGRTCIRLCSIRIVAIAVAILVCPLCWVVWEGIVALRGTVIITIGATIDVDIRKPILCRACIWKNS